MKLALISSPDEFPIQEYMRLGYHLALAQELMQDTKYHNYYISKSRESDFIIVDNGAAELGRSLEFSDVLDVANSVDADEVCLPDVLKDKMSTLALHYENYDKVPVRNRMVIPQGESIKQWLECLLEMLEVFDFRTIGIPKHMNDYVGGRLALLEAIQKSRYHLEFNVHLLGCHNSPLQEAREVMKKYPWVRGIDTAAPFAHAQAKQRMNYSKHLSYNWREKVKDTDLAIRNCIDMNDACWRGL